MRVPVGDVLLTCTRTDSIATDADIEQLARRLYRLTTGADALPLRVRWSTTATRAFGTATYSRSRRYAELMLSRPVWAIASDEQRREVIAHELAHLVVMYRHRLELRMSKEPHGAEWQAVMRTFGYANPCATHKLHVASKRTGSIELGCRCAKVSITLERAARARSLTCRRCRTAFLPVDDATMIALVLMRTRAGTITASPEIAARILRAAPGLTNAPVGVVIDVARSLATMPDAVAACRAAMPIVVG